MNKKLLLTLLLVGSSTALFGADSGISNFVYSRVARHAQERLAVAQRAAAAEQRIADRKEAAKPKVLKNLHTRSQSFAEQQESTERLSTPASSRPGTPAVSLPSSGYASKASSRRTSRSGSPTDSLYSRYSTSSQYSQDRESRASLLSSGRSSTYQEQKQNPEKNIYHLVDDKTHGTIFTKETPQERAAQQARVVQERRAYESRTRQTQANIEELKDILWAIKRLDIQDSRDLSLEELTKAIKTSNDSLHTSTKFVEISKDRVDQQIEELYGQLSEETVAQIKSDYKELDLSAKAKAVVKAVKSLNS